MTNSTPSRGRAVLTLVLLAAALAAIAGWAYLRRDSTPASSATLAIPPDFGGTVRAADLDKLADAAGNDRLNGMSLALAFRGRDARPTFAIGDRVELAATAGEPARCVLLHRNARGAFRVFHPERGDSFAVGRQRWDSGALRVTEPDGEESFLLVCRSEGASDLNLQSVLERPPDEWRRSFSAVRADYDVRR